MRSITRNFDLLRWLKAAPLLLTLVCINETQAAEFAITDATWDTQNQKLVVQGTGTQRNRVTVYNADNDQRLGRVRVENNGAWTMTADNISPVPCSVRAIQSRGGSAGPVDVGGAPAACNPPVNTSPVCAINTPPGNPTISAGGTVNYTGTITDADGNRDTIAWSFQGGTPSASTAQSPGSVTYNAPGVYTTTLDATDTDGAACVQQIRTITVEGQQGGQIPDPVAQENNAGLLGTDYPGHVVLAANDLGMHCADQDDRIFSVLPPFNVLHAQVVRRGTGANNPPTVLTDAEVSVVYSAASNPNDPVGPNSINSTSANFPVGQNGQPLIYKGNFWKLDPPATGNTIGFDVYAPLFFGLLDPNVLPQDLGLPAPETMLLRDCLPPPFANGTGDCAFAQQAMPGINEPYSDNVPQDTQFDHDFGFFTDLLGGLNGVNGRPLGGTVTGVNWFRADGIPILPVDDQGRENSYPLVRVQALQDGNSVASTDVVLPVAAEADCQLCHADPIDCVDPNLPPEIQTDQCNGLAYPPTSITSTSFVGETINGAPGDTTEQKLLNAAKINILRLHDAKHGTTLDATRKVVCASCHYSPALDLAQVGPTDTADGTAGGGLPGTQQTQHISMSRAMHGHHGALMFNGEKVFPDMPPPVNNLGEARDPLLSADILQETCYQCHPGKRTKCLRGAMGGAGIVCQDCHGSMTQVGDDFTKNFPVDGSADFSRRVSWASEPKCQSCHTGDAASPNHPSGAIIAPDGIRLLQAYLDFEHADQGGNAMPIVSPNSRFGENETLYRLSGNDDGSGKGHGGLMCEGCHGSTHAIWPNANEKSNDNIAAKQLQGHTGSIVQCSTCHENDLGLSKNGPHGLHQVASISMNDGQIDTTVAFTTWNEDHKQVNDSSCRACHGNNGQGTVLSRTAADRTLLCKEDEKCDGKFMINGEEKRLIFVPKGTEVSCTLCHDNKIK